jgi:predicted nucleic acid-binding protein
MILVDSSIWIQADRKPESQEAQELDSLLAEYEVATTEVVLAEVLQGAPTEEKFMALAERMDALDFYSANQETWLKAARLSFELRRRGLATALSDLVVATVALEHDLSVYTLDEDFRRVPGLRLHQTR